MAGCWHNLGIRQEASLGSWQGHFHQQRELQCILFCKRTCINLVRPRVDITVNCTELRGGAWWLVWREASSYEQERMDTSQWGFLQWSRGCGVSLQGWGQSSVIERGILLRTIWQGSGLTPGSLQGWVDPCLLSPSGPWTLRAEIAACPTTSRAAEKGFTLILNSGHPRPGEGGREGGQLLEAASS